MAKLRTGGLVLAFVAATLVAAPASQVSAVDAQAAPAIGVTAMNVHLRKLQTIADGNGGNRAAGTTGYTQSAAYVAQVLTSAGYTVVRQRCTTCTNTRDENVIATWAGTTQNSIMLGAHLDGVRAGAGIEDNGSGSAALLEIALAVASAKPGFTRTIKFAWWAEEELGMHGSRHYVNTTGVGGIDAYIGMDMIAGTNAGYFVNNLNAGQSGPFAAYLTSVGKAPEEFTDCCSDDQSFAQAGVPSTLLTTGYGENKTAAQAQKWGGTAGRPFDPCYHTACDTYPTNINTTAFGQMANAVATGLWAIANRQINPHTPEEVCGSGFAVVDSHSFGAEVGAVFLLYSSATGNNCVTTIKYTKVGAASPVSAVLQPQGGTQVEDRGNFSYYAGPVKAHAPNVCVRWGGSVDAKSWLSPYEHCG
jgi:aminopeptidase S